MANFYAVKRQSNGEIILLFPSLKGAQKFVASNNIFFSSLAPFTIEEKACVEETKLKIETDENKIYLKPKPE
ncbi:MAG: hypothetical protein ACFFDN_00810 [Candidatus Hodarchaeota archaeon]